MRRLLSWACLGVVGGCLGLVPAAAGARAPMVHFSVFARTGIGVNGIVWTGKRFIYAENTTNAIWSAPAAGMPLEPFADLPDNQEETRCVLSPGAHGFPAGAIFCHAPDHKLYELSADGKTVTLFATLPAVFPPASDGALSFDETGKFGFDLVAATGRSGAATPSGGVVYAVDPSGRVREIGGYHGPGGADEVMIAPAGFGLVGGDALLTVDAGPSGTVVAMAPDGTTKVLARLPDGANPIVAIPSASSRPASDGGGPPAGLYVTDDITHNVYFAPAADLKPFAGDVIVGGESRAPFWILEPRGDGFRLVRLRHTLRGGKYSLEAAIYVR